MFVTNEACKSTFPRFFAAPDELYWTAAKLALHVPWFLVRFSQTEETDGGENIAFHETVMLTDVRDVAGLVQSCADGVLKSAAAYVITPGHVNGTNDWKMESLKAVWLANEPDTPTRKVTIFETIEGSRYGMSSLETPLEALCNWTLSFRVPHEATPESRRPSKAPIGVSGSRSGKQRLPKAR